MQQVDTQSESERPARLLGRIRAPLLWALVLLAGMAVATLLDPPFYRALVHPPWDERPNWMELFRSLGYFPTWLLVAASMLLIDRRRQAGLTFRLYSRRAQLLFWPGFTAGVTAAVLKILIRRERPWYTGGQYEFRSIYTDEGFLHGGGLGLPSSHMAVVGAAAYVLTRLYPAGAPVWIFLVLGCALSRLEHGVHFLSDVYAGTVLGCLVGHLFWRRYAGITPSDGGSSPGPPASPRS